MLISVPGVNLESLLFVAGWWGRARARLYLSGSLSSFPSTCGSDPPQSCIFSQVLNVGAFLGAPAEPGWRVGSEGHRRSRAGGGCGSGVRGTAQAVALDSGSVFALHGLGLRSEAAACEWTLALTLFLLFGLFAVDFRHIQSCSVRLQRRAPAPALELGATSTQTLAL
uniref:Uncharacterized protein n=1 Tax=Chrysemys picta bellii TaxID=8478 RepID=A0A8C3PC34_CHRPI